MRGEGEGRRMRGCKVKGREKVEGEGGKRGYTTNKEDERNYQKYFQNK